LLGACALVGWNPQDSLAESSKPAAASPQRPNILILYADDLGYGDLSSYNPNSKIPTVHLDRLAEEGMRFSDAHSSSAICTPARYSLLTGRYAWRKFRGIVGAFGPSKLDADEFTLPEMLHTKGYTTAIIGKWHLGWDWSALAKPGALERAGQRWHFRNDDLDWSKPIPDGPLAHGFDYYFGDDVINFPPYAWIENDRVLGTPDRMVDTDLFKSVKEGGWGVRPGPMVEGWDPYENIPVTTAKGVKKIHKYAASEKPFFLFFSYPSPHEPIIPNDEFDGRSEAGPYGDFVVETDESIGTLLQALEDARVADNTIVIFTADNGAEVYAYPRYDKYGHWSSEPLRGIKRDNFEGGHRLPTIIRWPGVLPGGSVNDALLSHIDFMATIAAIVGAEIPEDQALDSYNQLPVWLGERSVVRKSHIHNTYDNFAIRHHDWLLIDADRGHDNLGRQSQINEWEERRGYENPNLPVMLFNLCRDLEQRFNIADDYPEKVVELRELMQRIREDGETATRLDH
jgi:arylsulfatase A